MLQELVINSLQHVGIPVTDIRLSEAFYRRLGFSNVMEAAFDFNNGKGSCIMMRRDNIMVEIYQFPEAELREIRKRGDGHVDHIAFDVPDIDKTFQIMKAEGFDIVEDAPVFLNFWKNGCRYFNILGPDGERLEFNQIL